MEMGTNPDKKSVTDSIVAENAGGGNRGIQCTSTLSRDFLSSGI